MHKADVPTFQLVVAYASRTLSSWSVALQEFVLRLLGAAPGDASRPALDVSSRCASAMPRAFQAATPLDLPHAPRSGRVRPYVTSIMYDDPYVVLGTQDNVLHVFQVEGAAADQSAVPAGPGGGAAARGARPAADAQHAEDVGPASHTAHVQGQEQGCVLSMPTGGPLGQRLVRVEAPASRMRS